MCECSHNNTKHIYYDIYYDHYQIQKLFRYIIIIYLSIRVK